MQGIVDTYLNIDLMLIGIRGMVFTINSIYFSA